MKEIMERYTCRDFTGQALTREQIDTIVAAALAAPSAMNLQPWRIIVVEDKSFIDTMNDAALSPENADQPWFSSIQERGGKMFYNAPLMIFIAVDDSKWAQHDCGVVSQNIALAAHSLGLGSCICGMAAIPLTGPRGEEFVAKLNFPEGFSFGMSVLVGAVKSGKAPHEPDYNKVSYIA